MFCNINALYLTSLAKDNRWCADQWNPMNAVGLNFPFTSCQGTIQLEISYVDAVQKILVTFPCPNHPLEAHVMPHKHLRQFLSGAGACNILN